MSDDVVRGRLLDPSATPTTGERIEDVLRVGNVVVEQILSGAVEGPLDYLQTHDEWVVVLAGAAVLEVGVLDVGGRQVELGPGDWVLLPANVPHRLVSVEPGTNWLGIHVHPGSAPPSSSPPSSS